MKLQQRILPFKVILAKLSEIFYQYKVDDIANALFVSSIWLPNIASPIQHKLLVAVFVSLKVENFKRGRSIKNYKDFQVFMRSLYKLLPVFPHQEDYITNPDWGIIKFHHEGKNFNIFYGTELENTYDLMQLFQIVYSSYNDYFLKLVNKSPKDDLGYCLSLQDHIISSIEQPLDITRLRNLAPGYKEIPPKSFWRQASNFYEGLDPQRVVNRTFLEYYSTNLGQLEINLTSQEQFEEFLYSGALLRYSFLRWNNRFLVLLPRRLLEVLLSDWFEIFEKYHDEICDSNGKYSTQLSIALYAYLKQRIRNDHLFGLVNVVKPNNQPHDMLFSAAILAHDHLILIYVIEPFTNPDQIKSDLKRIAPRLKEAQHLLTKAPIRFVLNLDKKVIEFKKRNKVNTKVHLLIVIPDATLQHVSISLPSSLTAEIVFLDEFLGIIDELDDTEDLIAFLKYREEIKGKVTFPFVSWLDFFGSFKDFHGVLIEGASNPNKILLDPHWGSNMRYESLKEFWSLYPEQDLFDHPRSWKPVRESPIRIRLEKKAYPGAVHYSKIGHITLFSTAPFEYFTYTQAMAADLLAQCLHDSMTRLRNKFLGHVFFRLYNQIHVIFFPSAIAKTEKFKHIVHLIPTRELWRSDSAFPLAHKPAIRLIFEEDNLLKAFQETTNNSIEINILVEILNRINDLVPDPSFSEIMVDLDTEREKPPRFKAFQLEKEVSFPEFIIAYKPNIFDYKRARKVMAELAAENGIMPGEYELESAKEILNQLRILMVGVIDKEVSKYDVAASIPYLIERIDAFEHNHSMRKQSLKYSIQHEVDFEPNEYYSKEHIDFINQHKHFRYLIEKFVQISPKGKQKLIKDEFLYLLALVENLHEIYTASDSIHYAIYPLGIHISEDYLIDVKYEVDIGAKQESYSREQARISLGEIGVQDDRVEYPKPITEYITEIDIGFVKDVGFKLTKMLAVLKVMTQWPEFDNQSTENSYYDATRNLLQKVCKKNILDTSEDEVGRILEFLTLKSPDVTHISGQEKPTDDIPVWESRKRFSRYNIRPLIYLNNRYYWGPYSAERAGIIWSNVPLNHVLPADFDFPTVNSILSAGHNLIEKALADKALTIVKRYTSFAEPNVYLHKRDQIGNHPEGLGDYDVLAYLPQANFLLNIECKEITPAYCAKDAKRMRERIFGRAPNDIGDLAKVEKRENYLRRKKKIIMQLLNFPTLFAKRTKVVSLFISKDTYWWTMHPIRSTTVVFKRIDLLSTFLEEMINKKPTKTLKQTLDLIIVDLTKKIKQAWKVSDP